MALEDAVISVVLRWGSSTKVANKLEWLCSRENSELFG